MGEYTELFIRFITRNSDFVKVPLERLPFIYYFFYDGHTVIDSVPPVHPLFETDDWKDIGHSNSYYTHPYTIRCHDMDFINDNHIFTNLSSIKGKDGVLVIKRFLDFISPLMLYYSFDEPTYIGYYRHEQEPIVPIGVMRDNNEVKYFSMEVSKWYTHKRIQRVL